MQINHRWVLPQAAQTIKQFLVGILKKITVIYARNFFSYRRKQFSFSCRCSTDFRKTYFSIMFFLISNLGIYFYRSPAVHCLICFAYKGNKNTVDSRGYLYEYCANDIRFDDYFHADFPASVYFKTLNFKIFSSFPRRLSQFKFL